MHLQNVLFRNCLTIVIFFFVSSLDSLHYTPSRLIELYVWFVSFFLSPRVKKLLFLFPCCTFCPLIQACYRYDKISPLFLYILHVIMVDRLPGYQMVPPIYRIRRKIIEFLTISSVSSLFHSRS